MRGLVLDVDGVVYCSGASASRSVAARGEHRAHALPTPDSSFPVDLKSRTIAVAS
jgi:hypothetical protein